MNSGECYNSAEFGPNPSSRFLQLINQKYEQDLKTYQDLHEWSINNLNEFWGEVWQYTGIVAKPFKQVS